MDKKKRNIIIIVCLSLLLVVIGVFVFVDIFSSGVPEKIIINDQDGDVLIADKEENEYENVNDSQNENRVDNIEVEINNTTDNDLDSENNNSSYNEEDVVSYFENIGNEVENSTSFKEKFKEYFICIVDFIFYEGEIKGYKFNELTGTAKAKIIAIALKIDSKIEEYIPGYKENISSTTGKIYTDIKERLVTTYMDISSSICKDNEEDCDKVKEIFSDIKEYCKIGWDFIKNLFKSGTDKVKDWYEIYSGK